MASVDTPTAPSHGLSESDYEKLRSWNSTAPECTHECLHTLVSQRAIQQPDNIAICAWDGAFTYAEFDTITTLLARTLASRGIGRGTYVPLCMEKSKWAIVAMFAIMKTGAAFVPMDPSQPVKALCVILGEVDANFVLCSRATEGLFMDEVNVTTVVVDAAPERSVDEDRTLPMVEPSDAAFIMFTVSMEDIIKRSSS